MESAQPVLSGLERSLPTKISGIVFWGTVLIGLLVALAVLENKRDELQKQQQANTDILQTVIAKSLDYSRDQGLTQRAQAELRANLKPFVDIIRCPAVTVSYQGITFVYGEPGDGHDMITKSLPIIPVFPNISRYSVSATVYADSIDSVLSAYRKVILLAIGSLTMIFGLILQYILRLMLTRPFSAMIDCAQHYADGDNKVRFNEASGDEFGFLGRFINRALDNDAYHFEQLTIALNRAVKTENALLNEKERVEVTLNSLSESVITTDVDGLIGYLNPAAEALTGWSTAEAQGRKLDDVVILVNLATSVAILSPIERCMVSRRTIDLGDDLALDLGGEQLVAIEASVAPMRNNKGEIIGAVMVCLDVSHTRELALQLSHQVNHDMLTNLYNRYAFEQQLGRLIENLEDDRQHALLYMDLDQFKIVNDTCGHSAGDELLRQMAELLHNCIRQSDYLARLGGDEFGILLIDCAMPRAQQIAETIRHTVKEFRFAWLENVFEVGVSVGVVEINSENRNPTALMSSADLACYVAKDGGRNRVHVYKHSDGELAKRYGEMHWTTLITEALEQNRFELYRQPICSVSEGRHVVSHWEILIRMRLEDGSIIAPVQFMSAAERYNMMGNIDRWVVYHTFAAIAEGRFDTETGDRMVSINLSGATLADDTMGRYIKDVGSQFGVNLREICFEVTETVAISNLTKATALINDLKSCGCSFSLDDFGSGLSSFGYLKNLAVDCVKIDGSFVKDMVNDRIDHAMVIAITQIGHVMNIKTIAEWVEDEATMESLREIGVDFAQGYFLGKPLPVHGGEDDAELISRVQLGG